MSPVDSEPAATSRLLRSILTLGSVDVAFAATVDGRTGAFVLDRFEGARTEQLRDLVIPPTTGLGGRCIALRRPVAVKDYAAARGITHEFDQQVSAAGLRAIFAVPVVGERGVSEIVYGAARRPIVFPDRLLDQAVGMVARSVDGARATEQVVAERLGRRMRDIRSELRGIADDLTDADLRTRLLDVLDRIPVAPVEAGLAPVKLTRRELEVLTEVAKGRGNRQVGLRLGLTEQTVKSYLRTAMTKLNSSSRGEAVYRARNAGLLP